MSISVLFHTQGIKGIEFKRWVWGNEEAKACISQHPHRLKCSSCESSKVTATPVSQRRIQGLQMGRLPFFVEVDMHRLKCHECGAFRMEELPFISSSHAKITRQLERGIIQLREHMSISAVARYFHLDWKAVKAVEKAHLKCKYRTIHLVDVTVLGIDEIYVGHKKYKTVVRDLLSGAVLHVGDGKGGDALKQFERRLASSKAKIQAVAMDMSGGYAAWVAKVLPDATVVYDHFHLIKLMNEKVDKVRRRTVNQLEEEERRALKKKRYLFLRNQENLEEDMQLELKQLCETFSDLGTMTAMKESLRAIYKVSQNSNDAKIGFVDWCKKADMSEIPELITMARTIRTRMDGILAFWTCNRLTSAGMEGFNNKIRWLIRVAYGYRDDEYFNLKIFDLPNIALDRHL